MTKFLAGLLAAILVLGLLAACQQTPGAAPGTPPVTTPDPDPKPDPKPIVLDLDYAGWRTPPASTGAFTWPITIVGSQDEGDDSPENLLAQLQFSKDHRGMTVALVDRQTTPNVLCELQNRPFAISELTITFSFTTTANCGTGIDSAFSAFDSQDDQSLSPNGVVTGDTIEISLTLAEAPKTDPVDTVSIQKISFTGTATVTHEEPSAGDDTKDTTTTFTITGTANYTRPMKVKP